MRLRSMLRVPEILRGTNSLAPLMLASLYPFEISVARREYTNERAGPGVLPVLQ